MHAENENQPRTLAICLACPRCEARERCWTNNPERPCSKLTQIQRWTDLAPKAHFRAKALAALTGVCLRHLERQFSEVLKSHPKEWLDDLLIAQAKQLLLSGKLVKEAAAQLGFAKPYSFSRLFKKKTGSSPAQFAASVVGDGQMSRNVASKSRFVVPPGLLN